MRWSRVLCTLWLALCSLGVNRAALPNFTKHLNYGSNDLALSYSIADDISFAHALCSRRNEHDGYQSSGKLYKRCRLILETIGSSGKTHSQSCDVKLRPEWRGASVARTFSLLRFSRDYLVLVWKEEEDSRHRTRRYIPYPIRLTYRKDYLHVRVVNMRGCTSQEQHFVAEQRDRIFEPIICGDQLNDQGDDAQCRSKINQTEIFAEDSSKIHNLNVVVNGHASFDVFFRNEYLCGRDKRCKVTYDPRANKFSSPPVASLEVDHDATVDIYPIVSIRDSSSVLAYVVRSLKLDDGAVRLLGVDGKAIYEHTYSWSPYNLLKGISTMAMSTSEETLGICQQPSNEALLRCSQFDLKATGLLGVDIALKSADVAIVEMRNRFDGGFLLLVGYGNSSTRNAFDALDVIRVDADGQLAHVHSANSYKCWHDESGVDVGFVDRDATKICYYMACTWPMPKKDVEETHLQLFAQCYTENEDARQH